MKLNAKQMKKYFHNFLCVTIFFSYISPSYCIAGDSTSFDPRDVSVIAKSISSIPVGTIITWPVATNPEGWDEGKWLECNGQTISQTVYPELFALTGGNIPNLQERTAWGSSSPGQYREAGLPNIAGRVTRVDDQMGLYEGTPTGAFYYDGPFVSHDWESHGGYSSPVVMMDASRCSPVYGRSATVQPAAYTVRFLIRAQP